MVSFPPVSPPRPYPLPSPHPYAPHAQPISFFSILSTAQYWVRSTNHLAPRYAISSIVKFNWNSTVLCELKHVVRKTEPPHQAFIHIGTPNVHKLKTTRILKKWAEASSETSFSTKGGVIFRETVIFVVAARRLCSSTYKLNYSVLYTILRKWKITLPPDTPTYWVRTVCRIRSRQFVHTV